MRVFITGGTGFIGQPLCRELLRNGHELTLVTRHRAGLKKAGQLPAQIVEWDMENTPAPRDLDPNAFDALIHLAGESIAGGLWSKARKKRILDSRVKTTQALRQWLMGREETIPVVLAASAVGYYSDKGGESLDESSPKGEGFLADVCQAWEDEVKALPAVREARLRFGVVIGHDGGFLKPLRLLTNFALGEIIGSGRQEMSFIHRRDLIEVILQALQDSRFQGAYNLVAPEVTTQGELQRTLSRLMRRPTFLRVPALLPRLAIGEMATLVLGSQHVVPKRLLELGYAFRYPTLVSALSEALDRQRISGDVP